MFPGDFMFNFAPIFIGIIFIIVFSMLAFTIISKFMEGIKNNNSPLLNVPAQVVAKRTKVQGSNSYTTYYVTFEVHSGDRMELKLSGSDYGMFAEEDLGILSFQGTRFVSFKRQKPEKHTSSQN
ncbi:DUF2500 domain-containing protein [Solibacillus sp. FSL H8-0538]|uniref:DUF2500 domain-containing protein n=1 Tax=Solibacillus sp. FSL H8-0538 TaxID=2921400 RepID=UPI0030FAE5C1